ncbi:MAG: ribosome small subunit-dependent GTPase A [Saprospiraceae bacterium]|nr:ribosome small subunit-dependent GTPase A [Saprospiraceae bacterium]
MVGLILRSTGSWYEVLLEESKKIISCRIVGKLKLDKENLTNPVAVGDRVELELENENQGNIHGVLPRKNYIARQSPKSRLQLHLIACNIDQALLISCMRDPILKIGFIDRFLLTTEPQNIPVIIVFNKWDIYTESDKSEYNELKNVYEKIGYEVHAVSSKDAMGVSELRLKLKNKTTLLSGQSGVGKSSLINQLNPGLNLKTSRLSGYSGKGIHTTTFAEMFPLDFGGYLIDTPGVKSLTFNNLDVMDIAHNYREFFKASANCRFGSQCTHRNEPDCAVKAEIANGTISEIRYKNYLNVLEEVEAQNFWERNRKY